MPVLFLIPNLQSPIWNQPFTRLQSLSFTVFHCRYYALTSHSYQPSAIPLQFTALGEAALFAVPLAHSTSKPSNSPTFTGLLGENIKPLPCF